MPGTHAAREPQARRGHPPLGRRPGSDPLRPCGRTREAPRIRPYPDGKASLVLKDFDSYTSSSLGLIAAARFAATRPAKALRIMGRRLMRLLLHRDFHFSSPAIGLAFSDLLDDAVGSWPPSSRRWPVRSRPANLPGRNGAPRPSPRSALATCG